MAEEQRYLEPFRQRDFRISCAAVSVIMALLMVCLFAGLLLRDNGDKNNDTDSSFVERIPTTPTAFIEPTAIGLLTTATPTPFSEIPTLWPTPTPLVLAPGGQNIPGGYPTPAPIPYDPYAPGAPPVVVIPVQPPQVIPSNPPPYVMPTDPPPPPVVPTEAPPPSDETSQGFQVVIRTRGGDSLFLINRTGQKALPLAPLRVGDGDGAINGSDWDVKKLKPGECVTVWNDEKKPKAPDVDCDRVGKKLEREGSKRFWREAFNVYYYDALIAVCTEERCSFTIPE